MKKTNFLFLAIFSVLLIAVVSASVSYGQFTDGTQSKTIIDGHNADFTSVFGSINLPMTINVKMYDLSGNLVYAFEDNKVVNSMTYTSDYTIDRAKYLGAGTYQIILSSSDKNGAGTPSIVTLAVAPNTPPAVTSAPVLTVNEGQAYSYAVAATDIDADTLTYSLSTNPGWLAIDPATGLITGIAPSVAADTNYNVAVDVFDGINTATQNYVLTVKNNVNPPVITAIPNQNLNEGQNYSHQAVATDIDGDVLTYSFVTNPTWLSINSSTGLITGTAPNNLASDTNYSVTVQVSDGINAVATSYTITVLNTIIVDTNAPVVTINYPHDGTTYDSDVTTLTFSAVDAEGNLLDCWYSANNGVTLSAKTSCTGIFNINSAEGSNKWIVYAEDTSGNVGSATVSFTVTTPSSSSASSSSNAVIYSYHDPNEITYQQQGKPITSSIINLATPVSSESFFARIIRAIIEFFKALFGLQ